MAAAATPHGTALPSSRERRQPHVALHTDEKRHTLLRGTAVIYVMHVRIVERVDSPRWTGKLPVLETERLLRCALQLHRELLVVGRMPTSVDMGLHLAPRRNARDEDSAQLLDAKVSHELERQVLQTRQLVASGVPNALMGLGYKAGNSLSFRQVGAQLLEVLPRVETHPDVRHLGMLAAVVFGPQLVLVPELGSGLDLLDYRSDLKPLDQLAQILHC